MRCVPGGVATGGPPTAGVTVGPPGTVVVAGATVGPDTLGVAGGLVPSPSCVGNGVKLGNGVILGRGVDVGMGVKEGRAVGKKVGADSGQKGSLAIIIFLCPGGP